MQEHNSESTLLKPSCNVSSIQSLGSNPPTRRTFLTKALGALAALALSATVKPLLATAEGADAEMSVLRAQLSKEIKLHSFITAISVTDLQTGESIDIAGNEVRWPGCVHNLFPIISVVRDLKEGLYDESDVGADISYTIENSDAETGRDLLIKTGMGDPLRGIDKVNALIASFGLQTTLYDHAPGYYWSESRYRNAANVTTTNEMNHVVTALWNTGILDYQWTVYLLNKMTEVRPGLNHLLAAPAWRGSGARVAHKNGFFFHPKDEGWVDNDSGIVWRVTSRGSYAYAATLFFQGVPERLENLTLGQRLSWLVWNFFDQRYLTA